MRQAVTRAWWTGLLTAVLAVGLIPIAVADDEGGFLGVSLAEDTDREIAESSLPLVSATVSVGASATASTVTSIVSTVSAVSDPSVLVAVTVSVKSVSLSAGGVIERPAS